MEKTGAAFWLQSPYWVRGLARIEGDEIVLDEADAETYYIQEPVDLLPDFARLAEFLDSRAKGERLALDFVQRHGLLWHGPDSLGSGKCRESLESWIYASLRIRIAATLYARLQETMRTGSVEPLQSLRGEIEWDWASLCEREPANEWEYTAFASLVVAQVVNEGLADSGHRVAAACALTDDDVTPKGPPGVFLFDVHSRTLEAAAYVAFSILLEHNASLSECPNCGRPFPPRSGKQKYCTESCANAARWQRWKEKHSAPA